MIKKIVFAIVCLISMSCGQTVNTDLAFVGSITGKYSPLLITSRNGALLAVEEQNSAGDVTYNFIVRDDGSDATMTEQRVLQLLEENISLYIIAVTSEAWLETEYLINDSDSLAISPTVSSNRYSEKDDNFIRTTVSITDYGFGLGSYAEDRGYKNVCIVVDENNRSYADSLIQGFRRGFRVSDTFEFSTVMFGGDSSNDYSLIGKRINDFTPDSVLIIASPFDTALILQHTRDEEYLRLISPWAVSSELVENGGRAVDGTVFFLPEGYPLSGNDSYNEFARTYRGRFGEEPSYISLVSYDSVNILSKAIKAVGDNDPGNIKEYLTSQQSFQGQVFEYKIDENGDSSYDLSAYTYDNGTITPLATAD